MKRPGLVVLTAVVALGCRSSQPTTNPFLRTTVPPPATGQGAVVVPGEPYTPGAVPPPGAAVPIDPSAVPVAPPPAAAPMVAPPPTVPPVKNNKYAPPGGSFQYNQSSREPRRARDAQLASRAEAADIDGADRGDGNEAVRLEDVQLEPVRDAVRLAAHGVKSDPEELAAEQGSDEVIEDAAKFGQPVPSHARVAKLVVPSNASSLRVVGSSDDFEPTPGDGSDGIEPAAATLRITAGSADSQAVQRAQWVVKEPAR